MKKILLTFIFILFLGKGFASAPDWHVNSAQFQYSMQVYTVVKLDNEILTGTDNMLGAFKDNECRGVVKAVHNAVIDKDMFFLVVYSNSDAETIQFKVYNASEDKVIDLSGSVAFKLNANVGSVESPYYLSNNVINNEVQFTLINAEENQALNALIGRFSCLVNNNNIEASYSIVNDFGDYGQFDIEGDSLVLGTSFNYEDKSTYQVKVKAETGSTTLYDTLQIEVKDVNEPPTEISLSNDTINENIAIGTTIADISVLDEDTLEQFTYSGLENDTVFAIVGDQLKTKCAINYESIDGFELTLGVTDKAGNFIEKQFSIVVKDCNDAPSALMLSADSIAADLPPYMTVGYFMASDEDLDDALTIALNGDVYDNASFMINPQNHHLITSASFSADDEKKIVEVIVNDSHGEELVKQFEINILDKGFNQNEEDVNSAPTAIILSNDTIDENVPIGTVVGELSAVDADSLEQFTFSVLGNDSVFEIYGTELRSKHKINYEEVSKYTVKIGVTDVASNFFEKEFIVDVRDFNDAPDALMLSTDTIAAGLPPFVTIGYFITSDEDKSDDLNIALNGDDYDNASFMIDPQTNQLITLTSFSVDEEKKTIEVVVNDGHGEELVKQFNIYILDKGFSYSIRTIEVTFTNDDVFNQVIEHEKGSFKVNIYPIDNYGHYNISSESMIQSYVLYDINGKELERNYLNKFDLIFDFTDKAAGTYLLYLYTDKGALCEKIVITGK